MTETPENLRGFIFPEIRQIARMRPCVSGRLPIYCMHRERKSRARKTHNARVMTMSTATTTAQISISVDGVWAGSGKLENGQIVDCGAQFCADPDESEEIYEMIEQAIAEGKAGVTVDHSDDDNSHRITWSIT